MAGSSAGWNRYPPGLQEEAVKAALAQAEHLRADLAPTGPDKSTMTPIRFESRPAILGA